MSECIEQKKESVKKITFPMVHKSFKEICPQWFRQLTEGTYSKELDITKYSCCVVGEAHEFNLDYANHFESSFCETCKDYSNDFPFEFTKGRRYKLTEEQINNNHTVKEFVKHWNKEHLHSSLA